MSDMNVHADTPVQICANALGLLLDEGEGVVVKHEDRLLIVAHVGDNIIVTTPQKEVTEEHIGRICVLCTDKAEAVTKATLDPNGGEVLQADEPWSEDEKTA